MIMPHDDAHDVLDEAKRQVADQRRTEGDEP